MHIVGPDVEEKRLRLMLLDELDGLARDAVGYVFVHPERALPPRIYPMREMPFTMAISCP